MPGAPLREDGPILMSEADLRPSVELIKPSPGSEGEVSDIVRSPSHATDW
jgi:hypothetical protein